MPHKYLNDIGISSNEYCIYSSDFIDDDRLNIWEEERKIHNFDSRETWSMDYTFATWLYEHLKMYLDVTNVDLTFHTFDIPVAHEISEDDLSYKESSLCADKYLEEIIENHTQGECINYIIDYLEKYFKISDDREFKSTVEMLKEEQMQYEYYKIAIKIWAEIFSAMWW